MHLGRSSLISLDGRVLIGAIMLEFQDVRRRQAGSPKWSSKKVARGWKKEGFCIEGESKPEVRTVERIIASYFVR